MKVLSMTGLEGAAAALRKHLAAAVKPVAVKDPFVPAKQIIRSFA